MKERAIYIFGAHSRARTLAYYIKNIWLDVKVGAFLIDNEEDNPEIADDIQVIHLNKSKELLEFSLPVYIATRGIYHDRIEKCLMELGFNTIIRVTPEFDTEIRNAFWRDFYEKKGKCFKKIEDLQIPAGEVTVSSEIYVAKTIFDQGISGYLLPYYAKYLQVGTELTEKRLNMEGEIVKENEKIAVLDNLGDNISAMNKQFCELTALYWMWKNSDSVVVGLEHYRRHFILPEDWLNRMIENEVDIILPIPLWVMPTLGDNYRLRHREEDLEFVFQYIKENDPNDYDCLVEFFSENMYCPCNMFIGRKFLLDSYCEWVFPILFALFEKNGSIEDRYQNRYLGFMAERLMSFYFIKKKKELNIVYANKTFADIK